VVAAYQVNYRSPLSPWPLFDRVFAC
jgi:hypothetical protein